MDPLIEKAINAVVMNWPLVLAIAFVGYKVFPKMLRETLLNGGGEIIRAIVASENAKQSVAHHAETTRIVGEAIRNHEEIEGARFGKALADLRTEITGEYVLQPRVRRGRRG